MGVGEGIAGLYVVAGLLQRDSILLPGGDAGASDEPG